MLYQDINSRIKNSNTLAKLKAKQYQAIPLDKWVFMFMMVMLFITIIAGAIAAAIGWNTFQMLTTLGFLVLHAALSISFSYNMRQKALYWFGLSAIAMAFLNWVSISLHVWHHIYPWPQALNGVVLFMLIHAGLISLFLKFHGWKKWLLLFVPMLLGYLFYSYDVGGLLYPFKARIGYFLFVWAVALFHISMLFHARGKYKAVLWTAIVCVCLVACILVANLSFNLIPKDEWNIAWGAIALLAFIDLATSAAIFIMWSLREFINRQPENIDDDITDVINGDDGNNKKDVSEQIRGFPTPL